MVSRFLARDGHHWQAKVPADHVGDLADRNALVADPIQPHAGDGRLHGQPEEVGGVEPVDGGPAVGAVTRVGRDALLARDVDQDRDEAVLNKLPGTPSGLSPVCNKNGGIGDTKTPFATRAEPYRPK